METAEDRPELERLFSDPEVRGGRNFPPERIAALSDASARQWQTNEFGRRLATEGARAALRLGFEQHRLERIISVTAAAHAAARRVMEKIGLAYQGTRFWMSPDVAVVWYALDRTTWEARAA